MTGVSNFKVGDRVSFRGVKGENGKPVVVYSDGPDWFTGTIDAKPYGVCYSVRYDDGTPVGLPFHDCSLSYPRD